MKCHEFDALFCSDDPRERDTVLRHADTCAACQERLQFEQRLNDTTKALRPKAPDLFPSIYARLQQQPAKESKLPPVLSAKSRRHGRWWIPAAAALFVALSLFAAFHGESGTEQPATLLSTQDLETALKTERSLKQDLKLLSAQIPAEITPTAAGAPLAEEARFLEEAINECRRALAMNERNRHLRQRLLDLTERRNSVLERLVEEA